MRAPRRVPWASKGELEELHDLLFSPTSDEITRARGLARMSVYISSPSCPTFVHLLYHLVSVSLLPRPKPGGESQATRLSCAMAVVRFVNGMVDPLQTGPYARPIAHLAASLNIPISLISLRHRATHEDLPPLTLLLHAVHQAIDYLHHHSFLPLLASSSSTSAALAGWEKSGRAEELVRGWKRVMKARVREREVGEETESAREKRGIMRELEGEEEGEVLEALCGQEGLVPVGRKKRPSLKDKSPSWTSVQIWTPLLSHLTELNPSFPSSLAEQIVLALLPHAECEYQHVAMEDAEAKEQQKEAQSFRWALATWLLWLWRGDTLTLAAEEKRELWRRLTGGLLAGDVVLRRVVPAIASIDPTLASSHSAFEPLLPPPTEQELQAPDLPSTDALTDNLEHTLGELEARLAALDDARRVRLVNIDIGVQVEDGGAASDAAGWRRPDGSSWRPCAMGLWCS